MTSYQPSPKQDIRLARKELAEAHQAFLARRGREAVQLTHLACFHAACAMSRAVGLPLPGEPLAARPGELTPGSPGGKSLAAFYAQLGRFRQRVDQDQETHVNIEEVANWLRQAGWFVDRMAQLVRRSVRA